MSVESPAMGSSKRRSLASVARALAISTNFCWPYPKFLAYWSLYWESPTSSSSANAFSLAHLFLSLTPLVRRSAPPTLSPLGFWQPRITLSSTVSFGKIRNELEGSGDPHLGNSVRIDAVQEALPSKPDLSFTRRKETR